MNKLPHGTRDWYDTWHALDLELRELGGVVTRVGDETVGEPGSRYEGKDVLDEVDPRFRRTS